MVLADSAFPSFGPLLKAFRTSRHFTQEQLATDVEMHRNEIGRWEQGNVLPANRGMVLDQAGAYLEATQCGLPAYLELFHTRHARFLEQRGEGVREHPASVSTTFTLAITATAQRHPAVWDLLRVCALLQPDAIPEELFRQGGEHLGTTLEVIRRDPLDWDQVVAIACAYSLLSRQPEEQTLSMHRLVQTVLLDSMTEAEWEQWIWRAVRALDAVFPEVLPVTGCVVWMWCERLLPHTLLCLHRVEATGEPLTFASLAYKAAQFLRERGQYTEAEPLFQRALHLREQSLGPNHPQVAQTLNYLAILYRRQGKYAEAEPLFQRALSIREQNLGPDHPDTAQTLHDLAIFHQRQGRLSEAISLAQCALSIRSQSLGEAHPQTIATRALYVQLVQEQVDGVEPPLERIRTLLKARGWTVHLKKRRDKSYVYATRKVGKHTQSRYLAPLSDLAACLAATWTLPNAKE